MMDNCNNPACKTDRAKLNKVTEEREADRVRVESLEELVASQKRDISELEHAKNEVIEKLVIATTEVR